MAVERDGNKLKSMFHNLLNEAKDSWNTRADEKTGQYYVKGKPAHSVPAVGGTFDYESDPNLAK